jgi:hypothetical protein
VPPAVVAVPGVEVRREPAVAHVAHRVGGHRGDFVAAVVHKSQPEPGQCGHSRDHADGQVPHAGLGLADGRWTQAGCRGQFALRQVGDPPDATQCSGQIERAHSASIESSVQL